MKKTTLLIVVLLVLVISRTGLAGLSPMVPRGIPLGSTVDARYTNSLVVFTHQHIYFLPWLEEVRKKAETLCPDFKIYIYLDERPEHIRQQNLLQAYHGAPEFFQAGGGQTEAIEFENEIYPAFYLFDNQNRLVYKHLGFVISDWYVLDEVFDTYLRHGALPEKLQEYTFDQYTRFPVITMDDFHGKSHTINISKPTMILISDPFTGEEPKRQMVLDMFVRLAVEFQGKADFYVIMQYDTEVELEQFQKYSKRYGIELPWKKENTFFKVLKRNREMKKLTIPVLVDRDREVWRKLGYPNTATIGIYDADGMLVDFRCAVCDIYNSIEPEYREMLTNLLNLE